MEKFWKWMEEKGYSDLDFKHMDDNVYLVYDDMPKQMLIGYMIGYLMINDYKVPNPDLCVDVESYYIILKERIENI